MLGIAKKAKSDKRYRFRNLYRELNEELLLDSWRLLRKDAALGVDRVSAAEYEANLEENIKQLVERLKRKRYRAKLVRRHYIPKGNGGMELVLLRGWGEFARTQRLWDQPSTKRREIIPVVNKKSTF